MLFLFASFCDPVSRAECGQQGDASAERGVGVFSVAVLGQGRKQRVSTVIPACAVYFFVGGTALEQAATIGISERSHAESEDDCDS